MQSNVILHIGRHKTGTTSLQRFFAMNERTLLERHGVLYPATGRVNHAHHPLFRAATTGDDGMDPALLAELTREVAASGAGTVLMSSESLSRQEVTTNQLQLIRQAFAGCPIRLIVYLRRQDEFMESSYAETVKRGRCAAPQGIHSFDFGLDHEAHVDRYAAVFGEYDVVVRPYPGSGSETIYRDFLQAVGLAWSDDLEMPPRRLNSRLPWLYIELLRYANAAAPARSLMHRNIVRRLFVGLGKRLPQLMDRPRPLTAEEKVELMARYREANAAVARRYLGREELFGAAPATDPQAGP